MTYNKRCHFSPFLKYLLFFVVLFSSSNIFGFSLWHFSLQKSTHSVMVFILSLNTIGIYSPTSYSCSGRQRLLKKHLHFEYSDIFSVTKCVRKCKPLFTLCSVSTLRRLCPGLVLQKKTLIFFSPSNNGMISFVILNKSDCSSFCQPALWSFITIWMVVFKFEWLAGFQDE